MNIRKKLRGIFLSVTAASFFITMPSNVSANTVSVSGDVNGDGEFTISDMVALQGWILEKDVILKNWENGDLSGDRILDSIDLCLMRKEFLRKSEQNTNEIMVSDIEELFVAMRNASPGDVILAAPGVYDYTDYQGAQKIDASASGTKDAPIILKGADPENPPVIRGKDVESGYVIQIKGDYWILENLVITTSQKGIVLDNSNHTIIRDCDIGNTGSEAVAIRDGSSYCTVKNCNIHDSGLVTTGYGEGVYIGSSYTVTGFDYKCDYNKVEDCTFRNIAAEHIDVKEYTTGTEISGCTFYGDGMSGDNYAGSFIDISGNECYVHDNIGYRNNNPKIAAAFEIHEQVNGWGYYHRFENNILYMDREYGEIDASRRMYVVDGWFSDFTVKNNLVDYGNGLIEAKPEHYNSDHVTFEKSDPGLKGKLMFHSYSEYEARDSVLKVYDFLSGDMSVIESEEFYHAMNGDFGSTADDIVFMAITKATDCWDVYRYNAESGIFTNLTKEGGFRNEDPKFSPDGKKVVFKRGYWDMEIDNFAYNLGEIDLETGQITMLTNDKIEEAMPYYSADGKVIYYAKGVGAESGIYAYNREKNAHYKVWDKENVQDYYPVADEEYLYYAAWLSESCHNDGIYRIKDGEVTSMEFNNENYNSSDPFPIDRENLIFSGTQNGDYDIYLYDGKIVRCLDVLNTDVHDLGAAYFPQ